MRAYVYVRACVGERVPMFSNDSCLGQSMVI